MDTSLKELKAVQEKLEPHLKKGDYSFIGPENQGLLTPFIKQVNEFAPVVGIIRLLIHALGNRQAVDMALRLLPSGTKLRIYVIHANKYDALLHDTVEGYCKANGITL